MCLAGLVAFPVLGYAQWIDTGEEAPPAEQPPNPEWEKYAFELPYADDSGTLSFEELARSDQPFVLFFWLNDCPVCHLQLPYVQRLLLDIEEYNLDLRLVSICLDRDPRDCQRLMEEKELTFEVLSDRNAQRTDEPFHLSELRTPLTYVFDSGGELVDYLTGFRSAYTKTILRMLDIELTAEP